MTLPAVYRVRQHFKAKSIEDVAGAVRAQFAGFDPGDKVKPGQSVALAVGSRGLHHLTTLVATTIDCLKALGLKPYIIPAMGSHGAATGEGQAEVLAGLGISEATMGVPVRATMDVASLGRLDNGAEVFFARDALEADHFAVINRVKPHTAFRSEVESGLCKIMAVGCGRQKGASNMHKFALGQTIVPAARLILEKVPVLCGLATVENPLGGIETISLARPEEFVAQDRDMLKLAWTLLPRIPLDDLDILVIDQMGKNISGAGIDPNVVGFWRREGGPREPDYRTIIVLDLSPESHGNATGIAMAELTTSRMMTQVDLKATYMNALTSKVLRSVKLPIALEDDRTAVETAVDNCPDPAGVRLVRIRSTLHLETFWATAALLPELRAQEGLTIEDEPRQLEFDASGRLLPPD